MSDVVRCGVLRDAPTRRRARRRVRHDGIPLPCHTPTATACGHRLPPSRLDGKGPVPLRDTLTRFPAALSPAKTDRERLLSSWPTSSRAAPYCGGLSGRASRGKDAMIGRTISHYEIQEKLGEGGMGVVYKARDLRLDRLRRPQVPPAEVMNDPVRRRRFIQEARAVSALNHPNIVTIHEVDELDGHFLAIELLEGARPSRRLGRQPLPCGAVAISASRLPRAGRRAPASCTATSSRRTSSSPSAARRRCWTSGWPSESLPRAPADRRRRARRRSGLTTRARRSARSPTCRRSRRAASDSTRGPTSSRSARCCTRWRPGTQPFGGSTAALVFDRVLNRQPDRVTELESRRPGRPRADHRAGAPEEARGALRLRRRRCSRTCGAARRPGARRSASRCRACC